jgi:hypothetical protein
MVQSPNADAFLDQLTLTHGPKEFLATFFFKAVHAAERRGVYLEFGTFTDLLQVNESNPESWMPLTTTFRENPGGVTNDTGFVLLGRNAIGEIVATQAARIFDWRKTNFKAEAESLRFFYADPERDKQKGEACIITAPHAKAIRGRVALGGGIWYRPDFRRRKLGEIIPRMGRAYAYTLWNCDLLIATITQQNIAKAFDKRAGYRVVTPDSMIMRHSATVPTGDLHLALAQMTPMQLIDDLFKFLVDFDAEVDSGVSQRRA